MLQAKHRITVDVRIGFLSARKISGTNPFVDLLELRAAHHVPTVKTLS